MGGCHSEPEVKDLGVMEILRYAQNDKSGSE